MAVTAVFPSPSLHYCLTNYSSNTRDEFKTTTFAYKAMHALSIGVNRNDVAVKVNEISLTVEGALWQVVSVVAITLTPSTVFGHANYSTNTTDEFKKTTFPCQTTHALSIAANRNIVAVMVNEM